MYVRHIHIRRFRHLHEIDLGPFREPPKGSDIIALAGPNGGGKSSVLELIGTALSSLWGLAYPVSRSMPESSFEIELGISQVERQLVIDELKKQQLEGMPERVIGYLEDHSTFFRAANYEGGGYSADPGLQNEVYNTLSQILRQQLKMSFGFFLRADRYYPQRGFARDQIFNFKQTRERQHALTSSFSLTHDQYAQIFDHLVQLRYHYFAELGHHEDARSKGRAVGEAPKDPMLEYDALLDRLFPGYHFADSGDDVPSDLLISLPSDEVVPFKDLSGGEKEVFFILSYFLRHEVSSAVILLDEPELHLHPELARTLIQQMMEIQPSNQIWVGTHNAEIIDEAGRDSVIYISRDPKTHHAVTTSGSDEPDAILALKNLFGLSGFVGVAPKMVFLEGLTSSADRKALSALFPQHRRIIKFIPAGGHSSQARINAAIMAILEANLGWMQFYAIRDHDFLTEEMVSKYEAHSSGRMSVLKRCSIENYLLVPEVIQTVMKEIFNQTLEVEEIDTELHELALAMSSQCVASMVSFRLNLLFWPEDFQLERFLSGQPLVDANGAIDQSKISILETSFGERVQQIRTDLDTKVDPTQTVALIASSAEQVRAALAGDAWKKVFPGKALLETFAGRRSLGKPVGFINSLIKELSNQSTYVALDLVQLIDKIASDPITA